MKRNPPETVEQRLEALHALAALEDRHAQNAALHAALQDSNFRIVAKAAKIVGERLLHERTADLKAAYSRLLEHAIKRDPKCIAKEAIARALVALECGDVEFYLAGLRYRQLEPVWGGHTDTAIDIRCSCAMGLVASGHYRALVELTQLLSDPEGRAREGAARAISCGNALAAEALLRLKVLSGDSEPEVIGECLSSLMTIAPEDSLAFVAQRLRDRDDAIRDLAALALGQSRHPGAFAHLRAAWDHAVVGPEFRNVLIRAAGVHRSDEAFDWLLSIIEGGAQVHADAAVDALSVYERNTKLAERVRQALSQRAEANGGNGKL